MSKSLLRSLLTSVILSAALCNSVAHAAYPVTQIMFDNHTDLALNALIAGVPGKPIPAQISNYPVPYTAVWYACAYSGVMHSCPIGFTDQKNGLPVATVNIKVENAQVMGAPTIYPPYSGMFSVSGWEAIPVQRITINKI